MTKSTTLSASEGVIRRSSHLAFPTGPHRNIPMKLRVQEITAFDACPGWQLRRSRGAGSLHPHFQTIEILQSILKDWGDCAQQHTSSPWGCVETSVVHLWNQFFTTVRATKNFIYDRRKYRSKIKDIQPNGTAVRINYNPFQCACKIHSSNLILCELKWSLRGPGPPYQEGNSAIHRHTWMQG